MGDTLEKYVNNSVPKISIPGNEKCNHFQLIDYLKENYYIKERHVARWTDSSSLDKTLEALKGEFVKLFTLERRIIIEKVLNLRFHKLKNIIQ